MRHVKQTQPHDLQVFPIEIHTLVNTPLGRKKKVQTIGWRLQCRWCGANQEGKLEDPALIRLSRRKCGKFHEGQKAKENMKNPSGSQDELL